MGRAAGEQYFPCPCRKLSDVAERMIFQRDYTVAELCAEKTPAGLAQGMSRAMGEISRQILLDLQKALKSR